MFTEMGWNVSPLAIIPELSTVVWLVFALSSLAAGLRHRGEYNPHNSREALET